MSVDFVLGISIIGSESCASIVVQVTSEMMSYMLPDMSAGAQFHSKYILLLMLFLIHFSKYFKYFMGIFCRA